MTIFDTVRIGQEVFAAQRAAFRDELFKALCLVRFLQQSGMNHFVVTPYQAAPAVSEPSDLKPVSFHTLPDGTPYTMPVGNPQSQGFRFYGDFEMWAGDAHIPFLPYF